MSDDAHTHPRQPRRQARQFLEHWSPKIVARYNDNEVRLVKTDGEFVWHKHDETDELFLILEGEFDMDSATVR